jgi:CDP-paratose 2-epimerase
LVGSINCFNLALKNNALLIFLSTSRVYPIDLIESADFLEHDDSYSFAPNQTVDGISHYGISENLSINGSRTFYGTTKLSSELFLDEYHRFYNLKFISTRFGIIAGPRQMGKNDQGVATLWMARHFYGGELSYIGYNGLGKQFRDILHIEDLLELISLQIHEPQKFIGKTLNAGGGIENTLSLQQMTKLCVAITGNKIDIKPIVATNRTDLKGYISDIRKIKNETGWQPKRTPEKVFEDIFLWIKKNELELKSILK